MRTFKKSAAVLLAVIMLLGLLPTTVAAALQGSSDQPAAAPIVGEESVATAEPEVTAEPETTAEPEVTAEPEITAEPEVMAEPETTAEPEVTAEPKTTAEPEVTAEPETTAEPEVTAEPETTAEPEVTAEPETTAEPEVTAEPETTKEPGASDELQKQEPEKPDELSEDDIALLSLNGMLPTTEIEANLVVSNLPAEDLSAVSVSYILNHLEDSSGGAITVSDNPSKVWMYIKDIENDVVLDDFKEIGLNETIDLTPVADITTYRLELIVGDGAQLNPKNVRYIIRVYTSNELSESLSYELYTQTDSGERHKVVPFKTSITNNDQLGKDIQMVIYAVPEHQEGNEYYLGINSEVARHPNITVEVYKISNIYDFANCVENDGGGTNITDEILNQNMAMTGTGYKSKLNKIQTSLTDTYDGFFYLKYTDTSGRKITDTFINIAVVTDVSYIDGDLYTYDREGQMSDAVCIQVDYVDIDLSGVGNGIQSMYYMLKEGVSQNDELYLVFTAHGTEYGEDANKYVVKAVEGLYNSLTDATNQLDIKNDLLPTDLNSVPRGYKANYNYLNHGKYFTVFFEDGSIFKFQICVIDYNRADDPNYQQSFTDAPIIGASDPWFRVTGAKSEGKELETFVVKNGNAINMDTVYGYGYQTIVINDPTVNLSNLEPEFWVSNPENIKLYVNGKPLTAGETLDCTNMVQFTAIIDGHQKNYQVRFVKKAEGAKLFVSGPSTREVFLDEYFEYKHDILIANVGTQPLTGVNVKLDATNCKLDEYWTVGGDGNNVLPAMTSVDENETANFAKIRLIPDGEGPIEGTITITADGQEPVVVRLTGQAQNPKIITEELPDGVKYVPYSHLITTSNMYDWTNVNFTLTGTLPEGIDWYPETGEIYGVPQESGEFDVHIDATFTSDTYTFESSSVDLKLTILDNTNYNVYMASDEGYGLLETIGTDVGGYDFVLDSEADGTFTDQVFRSEAEFLDFQGHVYLNGQELVKDEDYKAESGSTVITVFAETLENKADGEGNNTIAAEFRVDGERENELKRSAQNFRLNVNTTTSTPTPTQVPVNPTSAPTHAPTNTSKPGNTGSSENAGGNTSNRGTSNMTTAPVVNTVTCQVFLVDGANKPLANYALELHSTPIASTTNSAGLATFSGVEFGEHTLHALGKTGKSVATKTFTLASGQPAVNSDVITLQTNAIVKMTMKLSGNTLELVSAEVSTPPTGDETSGAVYIGMLCVASMALGVIVLRWKKEKDIYR